MDRTGRRAALGLGAAAVASMSLAAAGDPSIRALAWLAPGADPVAALDRPPGECLATPADPGQAYLVEIGRAAFRTPVLLGGQAARSGVSCETCHQSGRSNPAFDFPGVSGSPGTADVTSSTFSSRRGDGLANPKPIPDLSGPKAALKVAQTDDGAALKTFIRGLVVEEFDGREPDAKVLAGVVAYVRALSPDACPAQAARVDFAAMMSEAARAADAAAAALRHGDREAALTAIAAVRWRLGLIDERFEGAGLASAGLRLRAADRRLAGIAEAARRGDGAAEASLQQWSQDLPALQRALAPLESRSLFAPERLRAEAARNPGRGLLAAGAAARAAQLTAKQ